MSRPRFRLIGMSIALFGLLAAPACAAAVTATAIGLDPAPEAAPFFLIGSGLIGLVAFRKKFGAH